MTSYEVSCSILPWHHVAIQKASDFGHFKFPMFALGMLSILYGLLESEKGVGLEMMITI